MTDLDDDLLTVSVLYRRAESHAFHTDGVEARVRAALASDPALDAQVREAWAQVQARITDSFARMFPTTRKARAAGQGPKAYEVHHTLCVARESFLLALAPHGTAAASWDPMAAAHLALRRVGVEGDLAAFLDSQRALFPSAHGALA